MTASAYNHAGNYLFWLHLPAMKLTATSTEAAATQDTPQHAPFFATAPQ